MLFTNRRVAYALLWLLNHIPFVKHDFEVVTIQVELHPTPTEADWTPEQRMQLEDLLSDTESG